MLNCERVLLPKSPAKHNNVLGLRVVSTCRSLRQNDLPTAKTWMASKPSIKTIKIFKIGSTPPRVVSHTNREMIVADPLIKSRLKSRAVWVFHWPHFPSPSLAWEVEVTKISRVVIKKETFPEPPIQRLGEDHLKNHHFPSSYFVVVDIFPSENQDDPL